MKLFRSGIKNGVIEDYYGIHGEQFHENGVPSYSLPFEIVDAPEGTKSFALFLEDKDACPISGGFFWVQWVASKITRKKIQENEKERKAISGIQKKAREMAKKVRLKNKKLRDFRIHLGDNNERAAEPMILITEGNSASG